MPNDMSVTMGLSDNDEQQSHSIKYPHKRRSKPMHSKTHANSLKIIMLMLGYRRLYMFVS